MPGCDSTGAAGKELPTSEVGAVAGRSYPMPEARGSGQEDLPQVQGAVAVQAQEGREELLHVQVKEEQQ